MTLKNYQSTIAIVISALLMTTSCDENSNLPKPAKTTGSQTQATSSARLANYTFDGTEGGAITLDVAGRWINNYVNQSLGNLTAHFIGQKALQKMLAQNGSMGIRFYYSIDDSGNPVVFATGADGNGQDFSSAYGQHGKNSSVDLNVKASASALFSSIDADSVILDTSKRWRSNYTTANPSGIQAHFFGFEIIKQILAATGCVGIRCYYALNDVGVQQLLLVGVTSSGQNILPVSPLGGRTADDGTIADLSVTCPTVCSGN
jgi:hypothetical protein